MSALTSSVVTVVDAGETITVTVQPMRVGPTWNNGGFPLTCGHRHVIGSTVWHGPDRYGDQVLVCDRCAKGGAR
jgi:hypothetical protein